MIAAANEPIPISDLRLFPLFPVVAYVVGRGLADPDAAPAGPDDGGCGDTTVPTGIFPGVVPVGSAGGAPAAADVIFAPPAAGVLVGAASDGVASDGAASVGIASVGVATV